MYQRRAHGLDSFSRSAANTKQCSLRNGQGGKLVGSTTAAQWVEAEQILEQRQGWIRNTSPEKKSRSGSPQNRDCSQSRDEMADSAVWNYLDDKASLERDVAPGEDDANGRSVNGSPERGRLRSREDEEHRKEHCRRKAIRFGRRRKITA